MEEAKDAMLNGARETERFRSRLMELFSGFCDLPGNLEPPSEPIKICRLLDEQSLADLFQGSDFDRIVN